MGGEGNFLCLSRSFKGFNPLNGDWEKDITFATMCGIAGIYGLKDVDAAGARMQKMLDRIAHRGPDAEGMYRQSPVLLGHRRLSIIDLNETSNQPFISHDGRYVLVFNGEIYNYRELRAQLRDYPFRTNSDTEVLLAAFATWGIRACQLFNGMYAFAIWDNQSEKLWLVRDRLGIKPLYFARGNSCLVFASEIRSILASGLIAPRLNRAMLTEYLRYQTVHAPNTLVSGIKLLKPGTYLEVSDNEVKKTRYWFPWQKEHHTTEVETIRQNVRDLFTRSVERRLVADVPFGAFLSGGIDSSLVVAVMSRSLDRKVDTFNVSFDESEYSEAVFARSIAGKFHCNHHEILLKPSAFLASLPDALASMDHPSGDGPNTWIVSRETKKQGITMALSGLGGDELFGGYEVFRRIPYIADKGWILSFPKALRSMAGKLLEAAKPGIASAKTRELLLSDYFDLEHLYPVFRKVLLDHQCKQLLGEDFQPGNNVQRLLREFEEYPAFSALPVLSRISVAEIYTYMQNVLLRDTDQMSMAHALEVRVPFLDHELVEYVMRVPDFAKFPHTPKKLLIESFADVLPVEVVNRPKMGFVLPWDHWMREELRAFCEDHLHRLGKKGVVNDNYLQQLWSDFLANKTNVTWSRIWPVVVLADWIERNGIET